LGNDKGFYCFSDLPERCFMSNNGNNMHFIRYSHRVADNGEEEYLARKEKKKCQMEQQVEYEKLNEYDKESTLSL